MGRRESSTWYTVYAAYRDQLIVIGNARECAAFMGCTVNSFQSMVSKVKSGRNKSYCVVVEDLATGSYAVYGSGNTGELRGRPKLLDDGISFEMYAAGSSDADIARRLGVDYRTVWTWRKKEGLPPNAHRGRPRKVVA